MRSFNQRSRSEHGAVAVMVGILASVVFASSAMAVDLGSAWARKREVQKQVDISALSVGSMLPMTSVNRLAIAQKVADYFTSQANTVTGQQAVTGTQLVNGSTSDGEIWFQHADFSPCTEDCPQMRVLAPPARVEFGLASAIGFSHTMVQQEATVRIASELPPREKAIPFWLPTGCGYGPTEGDTNQGNQPEPTPTVTATASPTATATSSPVPYVPTPVGTHVLIGVAVTPIAYLGTINVSGYSVSAVGSQFKKVTLRAYPPTGTAFVDFAAQTTGNGSVPTFQVSQEVSATPGDWRVYALAEKNNSLEFSATNLILRVAEPVGPVPTPTATTDGGNNAVGCVGQDRGNFGQLDAPRREGGTKQIRLGKNLALGLDHELLPYVFPVGLTEKKDCGSGGTLLPGAQLDTVSREGNNCITGDTGNDGPKIMEGLVTGIASGAPGRLDVANGATTCPGRNNLSLAGKTLNNDVLSCFLRNGATLSDIAQISGVTTDMLDRSVLESPRFVWLPVVYATDRAQKNYQPVRHFVPGFITDETQTTAPTALNGIEIDGNSVVVLHIFTFNRDALPTTETSGTTDYDPEIGGGIVRLIR